MSGADAPRGAHAPAALRVLVVDDDVDAAQGMVMLLEALGHDATMALDGPTALEAVRSRRPDVALVDIRLPGMDGYELVGRMRELEAATRIRFVALTGYSLPEDRARALAAGFHEHLGKPVEVDYLEKLLAIGPVP